MDSIASSPAAGKFGALAARQNLVSSIEAFQLSLADANAIIDEVQEVIRTRWRSCCRDREVNEADIARLEGCFNPPFFESELSPNILM